MWLGVRGVGLHHSLETCVWCNTQQQQQRSDFQGRVNVSTSARSGWSGAAPVSKPSGGAEGGNVVGVVAAAHGELNRV